LHGANGAKRARGLASEAMEPGAVVGHAKQRAHCGGF
jgi:hypothetical protein